MPLAQQVKTNFSLAKGFISDASYVNFPEDATVDELNFTIEKDGSRKKRPGVSIPLAGPTGGFTTTVSPGMITSTYVWNNPNNEDRKFLVHQNDTVIAINDITDNPVDITTVLIAGINLESYINQSVPDNPWLGGIPQRLHYSAGAGYLFITAHGLWPIAISWKDDAIDHQNIRVYIRDFEGIPSKSSTDSTYRISVENLYNYRNAGWPVNIQDEGLVNVDPLFLYLWLFGKEPPLNTPWYFGNKTAATSQEVIGKWASGEYRQAQFGSSDPIRGSCIMDLAGQSRRIGGIDPSYIGIQDSGVSRPGVDNTTLSATRTGADLGSTWSPITTLNIYSLVAYEQAIDGNSTTLTSVYDNPSRNVIASCFYSGRFWVSAQDMVLYSQIVNNLGDASKFYQENDPTNEQISDLLDSDGGVIKIPGAGRILALKEFGLGVLVFSANGIWFITGGDAGFTAKSYKVDKISSIPIRSAYNILDVENVLFIYNEYGIYSVQANEMGGVGFSEITENTISQFWTNIGLTAIASSKPLFDPITKELYIFYSDVSDAITLQQYNKILGIKLPSMAFFKYEISAEDSPNGTFVYDCYVAPTTYSITDDWQVIRGNGDIVVTSGGDNVIVEGSLPSPALSKLKMLCMQGVTPNPTQYYIKEAVFDPTALSDFQSVNGWGIPFEAYLKTGYIIEGDVLRRKQAPYIQCLFNRTENRFIDFAGSIILDHQSSCLMQAHWDWTDHVNSGKIDNAVQVYRHIRNYIPAAPNEPFDDGYPVVFTRNKIRGRGRALHLTFTSPAWYDCHMIGWSMMLQGGTGI